jgi:hypothetical protein
LPTEAERDRPLILLGTKRKLQRFLPEHLLAISDLIEFKGLFWGGEEEVGENGKLNRLRC